MYCRVSYPMLGLESEAKLQTRVICLVISAVEVARFLSVDGFCFSQGLDKACERGEECSPGAHHIQTVFQLRYCLPPRSSPESARFGEESARL